MITLPLKHSCVVAVPGIPQPISSHLMQHCRGYFTELFSTKFVGYLFRKRRSHKETKCFQIYWNLLKLMRRRWALAKKASSGQSLPISIRGPGLRNYANLIFPNVWRRSPTTVLFGRPSSSPQGAPLCGPIEPEEKKKRRKPTVPCFSVSQTKVAMVERWSIHLHKRLMKAKMH